MKESKEHNKLKTAKVGFFKKGKEKLINSSVFQTSLSWTKKNSLPGFFNVSIYDVLTFIYREIREDSIATRAKSIAFSFFLSLFPTMLAFFTLIPMLIPFFEKTLLKIIPADKIIRSGAEIDFNATILAQIENMMAGLPIFPESGVHAIMGLAADFLNNSRFGLLSFGFLLALFFASNGMVTLMNGFEKSSHSGTFLRRNVLQKRMISLQMIFVMGILIVSSLALIIFGNPLLNFISDKLHLEGFIGYIIFVLRWVLVFLLFYSGIAIVYRLGIATTKKIRYFSVGTTLATVLSIASSIGFATYVDSFNRYNELYGSIGTIIAVMLWIQINAFIILIGFEFNASIAVNKTLNKVLPEEEEE